MSNYLSNLTTRSFNQAEVLRPRIASRFEPMSIASHLPVQPNLEQTSIAASDPFDLALETLTTETEVPQQLTLRSNNKFISSFQPSKLEPKQNFVEQKAETLEQSNLEPEPSQRSFVDLNSPNNAVTNVNSNSNREALQSIENLELDSQQESRSVSNQTQTATSQIQQQTQQNPPLLVPAETINQPPLVAPPPTMPFVDSDGIDPATDLVPGHSTQNTDKQQFISTENQPLQQSINSQTVLVPIATEHRLDSQKTISSNFRDRIDSIHDSVQNPAKDTIKNINQNVGISDSRLISQSSLTPHIVKPVVQPQVFLTSPTIPITEPVSEPTPTIQVTIGRIEVRATVAAPPLPKPRSSPAVMGLDDYLRQRAKGASQ